MKQPKQKQLLGLLKSHPNITDKTVHLWAKQKGYQVDRVEEGIYRIAGKCARRKLIGEDYD